MKQTQKYCDHCGRNVLAVGSTPNHPLHLLLCVLTCWLWVFIWPLVAVSSIGGYRCSRCGNEDLLPPRSKRHQDADNEDEDDEEERPRRRRRSRDDDDD